MVIVAATLNIREGPGSSYPVLGTAKAGERYMIMGENSNATWWQIDYHGRPGWVSGAYVKLQGTSNGLPVSTSVSQSSALKSSSEIFSERQTFKVAASQFGALQVLDFEDIDAGPINNSTSGRSPFDRMTFQDQGITFFSPSGLPLYIAPGGLFWNSSNSLSVGGFPYDTTESTDDRLLVSFTPPVVALGFALIDHEPANQSSHVQFLDIDNHVIAQSLIPPDYAPFRSFIGLVSLDSPIAAVRVSDATNDGDDVNYDDFTFVR